MLIHLNSHRPLPEKNGSWAEPVSRRLGWGKERKRVLFEHHYFFLCLSNNKKTTENDWVNCFWNKCILSHRSPPPPSCSLPLSHPLHAGKPLFSLSGKTKLLKKPWNKICMYMIILLSHQGVASSFSGQEGRCGLDRNTVHLQIHTSWPAHRCHWLVTDQITWSDSWGFSTHISLKPPGCWNMIPYWRQSSMLLRLDTFHETKSLALLQDMLCEGACVRPLGSLSLPVRSLLWESFLRTSRNTFLICHTDPVIQPSMSLTFFSCRWNYTETQLYLGASAVNFLSTREITLVLKQGVGQIYEHRKPVTKGGTAWVPTLFPPTYTNAP